MTEEAKSAIAARKLYDLAMSLQETLPNRELIVKDAQMFETHDQFGAKAAICIFIGEDNNGAIVVFNLDNYSVTLAALEALSNFEKGLSNYNPYRQVLADILGKMADSLAGAE